MRPSWHKRTCQIAYRSSRSVGVIHGRGFGASITPKWYLIKNKLKHIKLNSSEQRQTILETRCGREYLRLNNEHPHDNTTLLEAQGSMKRGPTCITAPAEIVAAN